VQGRKVSAHMKKEKKKEVIPEGSSSDCVFFVFVIERSESAHKSLKSITTLCVF
jgi:hypothetical protein